MGVTGAGVEDIHFGSGVEFDQGLLGSGRGLGLNGVGEDDALPRVSPFPNLGPHGGDLKNKEYRDRATQIAVVDAARSSFSES